MENYESRIIHKQNICNRTNKKFRNKEELEITYMLTLMRIDEEPIILFLHFQLSFRKKKFPLIFISYLTSYFMCDIFQNIGRFRCIL